jgi:putative peptide zinc metalloprotease protein
MRALDKLRPPNTLTPSAEESPLALRRRPDLVALPQHFRGRQWFVIHDPVATRYYYLTDEEYAILQSLDAVRSLADVQAEFQRRFAPRQLSLGQLQRFLGELHRRELVISETRGQGPALVQRERQRGDWGPLRLAERLLAIRFRGLHAQPLLDWLGPRCSWLVGWPGWIVWGVLLASAGVVVLSAGSELAARTPSAGEFLTPANAVWLAVALIAVKTLHEVGHALAAWRLGCAVPEIGLQLFFFLPCVYTNVSGSWLLASKWHRMAISAAGIYVELGLAAAALLVWRLAEPGPLASIAYSVMLVASLSTLLVNANPLMRYDGYYLLSDLVEVPNLEQRSRQQLVAWFSAASLGTGWQAPDPLDEEPRPLLALYAAAAIAYRLALLTGLYVVLRGVLRPWRLEPVSDVLLAAAVLGLVVPLVSQLRQLVIHARRQREFRPQRMWITAAVTSLLIAAFVLIPLPQRITAPAVLEAKGAQPVYVSVAGTLQETVAAGTAVKRGDPVARLESPELARDLARLESERRAEALHLAFLETAQSVDSQGAASIPAARETLADLDERIRQVRSLASRLTVAAPCDGQVLPPPPLAPADRTAKLGGWAGTPLDPENRGCYLQTATHLCTIAPRPPATQQSGSVAPSPVEAIAVVTQQDVALIEPGASVRIVVPQSAVSAVYGDVAEISQLEDAQFPEHLIATHALPARLDESGRPQPLGVMYRVRIKLSDELVGAAPGQVVNVAIAGRAQSVGTRLGRWLGSTFRFGWAD